MNVPKISKATIIRTIALLVTIINAVLMMFHKHLLPYGEADVSNFVNWVYGVVSAVGLGWAAFAAWWKDNDFTKKARIQKEQIKQQSK
ncbi:phage holin [Bacillota bacterium Lsc_1132]